MNPTFWHACAGVEIPRQPCSEWLSGFL